MKTPKELRIAIKKIQNSQTTRHERIKNVLLDIVEVLEDHGLTEEKPPLFYGDVTDGGVDSVPDDVTCKEVKPDGTLGEDILNFTPVDGATKELSTFADWKARKGDPNDTSESNKGKDEEVGPEAA